MYYCAAYLWIYNASRQCEATGQHVIMQVCRDFRTKTFEIFALGNSDAVNLLFMTPCNLVKVISVLGKHYCLYLQDNSFTCFFLFS